MPERKAKTMAQSLKIGTFVVNLNHTPAVVVGSRHGDPVLQGVNSYGRKSGGKWVADAGRCTVVDSALAAHELAGLRMALVGVR
jgi:hypothetical protein